MPKPEEDKVISLALGVEIDLLAVDDLVRVKVVNRSGDARYGGGSVFAVGYVEKAEDVPDIISREWPHIVRILKADVARRVLEEGDK